MNLEQVPDGGRIRGLAGIPLLTLGAELAREHNRAGSMVSSSRRLTLCLAAPVDTSCTWITRPDIDPVGRVNGHR